MFRKFLVGCILLSMTLHSAARLGVLNKLYEHRHHIAHSLGFIAEVPIALCSTDYKGNIDLAVYAQDDSGESTVPVTFSVQKIELTLPGIFDSSVASISFCYLKTVITPVIQRHYGSPLSSIFHPPS